MYERFKDAPWFVQHDIIIGGTGGIGSWLALLLARCGHTLYLYDNDIVELQNMGGQLYSRDHIGRRKTAAVRDICSKFANNESVSEMGLYEASSMTSNIVFAAFDNMKSRKLLAENWYKYQVEKAKQRAKDKLPVPEDEVNVFIDGRMEAESSIIYCIDSPAKYKRYMAEFFDDTEVPNAPCSFRSTSHNPAILAGNMVSVLNNILTNKRYKKAVREIPYKISYELPTFTYTLES